MVPESTSRIRRAGYRKRWVMGLLSSSLCCDLAYGQARVEVDGIGLKIEDEAVVEIFLDVIRNVRAAERPIVAETDFDGDVKESIPIGMNVKPDGGRQKRRGIEEEVNFTQALKGDKPVRN
jgi:hypothetical protein